VRHAIVVSALLLAGCGGGTSGGADPHVLAIQTALDFKAPTAMVYSGYACEQYGQYRDGGDPLRYAAFPGAHVGPVVKRPLFEGVVPASQIKPGGPTKSCREVTWDASAGITQTSPGSTFGRAPLGRYVVDKVGDEQDGILGTKFRPYRSHFVPSPLGTKLIAAGIAKQPDANDEGQAVFHKDADGKWVAQL